MVHEPSKDELRRMPNGGVVAYFRDATEQPDKYSQRCQTAIEQEVLWRMAHGYYSDEGLARQAQ